LKTCGKNFRVFHCTDWKILAFECEELFFLTCRKQGSCTSEGENCMKNGPKCGASLDSLLKPSRVLA